jgi:hypothetical protein
MKILGWILFILNILGLIFCIYSLQVEIKTWYLLASGVLLAQTIYIAKTLKILKKYEAAQAMLVGATKKAGLEMAKIFRREK